MSGFKKKTKNYIIKNSRLSSSGSRKQGFLQLKVQ